MTKNIECENEFRKKNEPYNPRCEHPKHDHNLNENLTQYNLNTFYDSFRTTMPTNETNSRCSLPGRTNSTLSFIELPFASTPNNPSPVFSFRNSTPHRETLSIVDEALRILNDDDSFVSPRDVGNRRRQAKADDQFNQPKQ